VGVFSEHSVHPVLGSKHFIMKPDFLLIDIYVKKNLPV